MPVQLFGVLDFAVRVVRALHFKLPARQQLEVPRLTTFFGAAGKPTAILAPLGSTSAATDGFAWALTLDGIYAQIHAEEAHVIVINAFWVPEVILSRFLHAKYIIGIKLAVLKGCGMPPRRKTIPMELLRLIFVFSLENKNYFISNQYPGN